MEQDPEFKMAFEALTPGRKRSYNLYYNAAKQSATRISRIEKSKQKILLGKGWNEYFELNRSSSHIYRCEQPHQHPRHHTQHWSDPGIRLCSDFMA